MSEICPTCGRKLPVPRPKYSSKEERAIGVRSKLEAAKQKRHERDRAVIAKLPDVFESADVGHELRRHGRFWSELHGLIGRALDYGAIVMIEPRYTAGGKKHRRFQKVVDAP